jgi:hypothetical protein
MHALFLKNEPIEPVGMPPGAAAQFSMLSGDDRRLCERVLGEFREMPGLVLTEPQAARLFSIEHETCARILGSLVESGVLRTDGRMFAARTSGRPSLRRSMR